MIIPQIKVLFLCTGNSCRSILAEALLRSKGKDRFISYSAGSKPSGKVHPLSLQVLEAHGLSTDSLYSKSWNQLADIRFDLIVTVCGSAREEACPVYLGHGLRTHWGVFDPPQVKVFSGQESQPFQQAFKILEHRIDALIAMQSLDLGDPITQQRIHDIGKLNPEGIDYGNI